MADSSSLDDAVERVALALAQRTSFNDGHLVAFLSSILFIVSHVFGVHGVLLTIQRVCLAGLHSHDNSFVGLVAGDLTDNR